MLDAEKKRVGKKIKKQRVQSGVHIQMAVAMQCHEQCSGMATCSLGCTEETQHDQGKKRYLDDPKVMWKRSS